VNSPRKPWWHQATALVSLGAGGAITGLAFVPGTADQIASPASIPVTLTALDHATKTAAANDTAVGSAIVGVANYYLRLAQGKTPAEVEALIWQQDSLDGADHGDSCAAFASMTLELGAQLVGRQSWVTGGSTYPWPLHDWADVRVDPNPASLGITSVLQDAQAHQRWHPLGDGYEPQPGDWVLFDGHVEVVTKYSGDVLSTVGGDSLPNFSVNAHQYPGPLAAQGVVGFVSNGNLPAATGAATSAPASAQPAQGGSAGGTAGATAPATQKAASGAATVYLAAIPGTSAAATWAGTGSDAVAGSGTPGTAAPAPGSATATLTADDPAIPGMPAATSGGGRTTPRTAATATQRPRPAGQSNPGVGPGTATRAGRPAVSGAGQTGAAEVSIPGMPAAAPAGQPTAPVARYRRSQPAPPAASSDGPGTAAQQAFINQVAPGAVAAQHTYGVPAAVTIAQAIDESAWGQSTLAARDNNLFGIKGTGPAGSDSMPTQEFQNGEWVTTTAPFRVYDNIAESINDHGKLLATSGYYTAAMAARNAPNSFAQALTGVYATDPNYGTNLISLMRRYNLYRFDPGAQSARAQAAAAAQSPAARSPATQSPAAQAPSTPSPVTQSPAADGRTSTAQALSRSGASARARTPGTAASPTSSAPATPTPTSPAAARRTPTPAAPQATARTSAPAQPRATPQATAPAQQPASQPATAPAQPLASQPVTAPAKRPAAPPPASRSHPNPTAPARGPSSSVPHPFATPQPAGSSASAGAAPGVSAAGTAGQAVIPGVQAPAAGRSAHTSAQLRSSSDTRVVTELAAVFRPTGPADTTSADDQAPTKSADRLARAGSAEQPAHPVNADQEADLAPASQRGLAASGNRPARGTAAPKKAAKRKPGAAKARKAAPRYLPQMPPAVKNAFLASARKPLARAELVYRDVAGTCGIPWKLLAACDWMQCEAHPRYSPVQGEKLGTVNLDGTVFRTKSEALTQCARDLIAVSDTVYQIDLTVPVELSVLELARVFAAFRWGGLLRLHNTSAMEFPYSIQGLTDQHTNMRWPRIDEPDAPDKPGARFRRPFGAVPVVLSLDYPATA
jgi:flagellum-specific peptidoglycan hydrolase FlgJ